MNDLDPTQRSHSMEILVQKFLEADIFLSHMSGFKKETTTLQDRKNTLYLLSGLLSLCHGNLSRGKETDIEF